MQPARPARSSRLYHFAAGLDGVGLAAALGLVVAGASGCHPNKLQCDLPPECPGWVQALKGDGGAPPAGEGGSGGGGPAGADGHDGGAAGAGGDARVEADVGGGAAGADGGGGAPGADTGAVVVGPASPVPGCALAATVAKVETDVLVPKCGSAGCHRDATNGDLFNNAGTEAFAKRLLATTTKACGSGGTKAKLLDGANGQHSMLSLKMAVTPSCPEGTSGSAGTSMRAFLTGSDSSKTDVAICLESYARVIAGGAP